MNKYQKTAEFIQNKLLADVSFIYKQNNNKLILKLSDKNLLESKNNTIVSSTALGYCVEEFLCNELTKKYPDFYYRNLEKTQRSSYDLFVFYNDIKILINFKMEKKNNNAIAALAQIRKDYIEKDNNYEKLFLIFKTSYSIKNVSINIENKFNSFFLEQCFFAEIKTDNRSWSKNNDNLSGRILYNHTKNGLKKLENISFLETKQNILKFIEQKKKWN